MKNALRILIVEDEPIVAADIRLQLEQLNYFVCGTAYTYHQGLELLQTAQPNLALLDIKLGQGQEGFDIAQHINNYHQIPFIFLTSYATRALIEEAKSLAPAGYIVKPFSEKNLLAGLEISLYNYERLPQQHAPISRDKINEHLDRPLTLREYEFLQFLLEGFTNKQIAEQLHLSINTVKTHKKHLFSKLAIHNRTDALRRIRDLTH